MNKATTTMVSTPMLWAEEDILSQEAKEQGVPRSALMRAAFVEYMKARKPKVAAMLVEIRSQHTRQQVASTICLFVLGIVLLQTWQQGGREFSRRSVRQTACRVRSVRRNEIDCGEVFSTGFEVEEGNV